MRPTKLILAPSLTITAAAVLVLAATPSLASTFKLKETFGSGGQPSFVNPVALTVDQANGDLLVVDTETKTISRYKADGTPDNFSGLASNVIDGKTGADETPQHGLTFTSNSRNVQIAVDVSGGLTNGDIYVTQRSEHLVDVFSANGGYLGQLTASSEGPFNLPVGVAVDASGAVYVSQFNGSAVINKFVPAANPPVNADNTANFARPGFGRLAAGAGPTAGSLFASSFNSELAKLDSATGVEQCMITPGESLAITVDPATGAVFNATENEVNEYSGACEAKPTPVASFSPGEKVRGIAVDGATGDVYVSRAGVPTIAVWEPVLLPEAHTEAASGVGAESVVLHGTVSAANGPATSCEFQYTAAEAENFSGATSVPCSPAGPFTGGGSEAVSAAVSGLSTGTAYKFRVVASNENGTAPGEALGFLTLGPALGEESVSGVGASTATIGGAIDTNGKETSFFVEYIDAGAYRANPESDRFAGAVKVPVLEREVPVGVVGSGDLKDGSRIVSNVSVSAGAFGVGETISGPGIPLDTKIVALPSVNELELSRPAVATVSAAVLTATGPQPVVQQLSGLTPDTTYHYRLVASDSDATAHGPDRTFVTFGLPGAGLPDGRAYEMVSPSHKTGEVIPPEPLAVLGSTCFGCLPGENALPMPVQGAADGESVLYRGQPFSAGLASGPNEYVSRRVSGGWGTQGLSEPVMTGLYQAFSPDLSRGVLYQVDPVLSPEAPTRGGLGFANLYLREGDGSLRPLVTEEPTHRDPSTPTNGGNQFVIGYAGANSGTGSVRAFDHVVFEANDALTGEVPGVAPRAPEAVAGNLSCALSAGCDLYEWADGGLRLVNVLPGNASAASGAVIGSGYLLASGKTADVDRAISADGSRIFWSAEETGHVYVRIDGERTLEVPGPGSCKKSVPQAERACFLTASEDGSRVLLANGQIDAINGAGSAYEQVSDLTGGHGGFRGILGASEDLSRVYFVDTAALTGNEENANGEHAENGKFNFYAWHRGSTVFIARETSTLSSDYKTLSASPSERLAQVTPDGSYLTFMSSSRLTGYDNTCAHLNLATLKHETIACPEVFVYAAGSGALTCASCNPSGERPLGWSNLSLVLTFEAPAAPFQQLHNLSSDGHGRLFFESQDVLSPQDTNGHITDVYEWEPNGIGSCKRTSGCVFLISSGHSPNDSMFVDSSASGEDAFFVTREQLLNSDKDEQLDLYDARAPHTPGEAVNFPEGETTPCGAEACKGSPASLPAAARALGSTIFSGPGNFALSFTGPPPPGIKPRTLTRAQKLANALKACAKRPKSRRGACRALARKRYGPPSNAKSAVGSRSHKGGK